jgi:hypothetical protein
MFAEKESVLDARHGIRTFRQATYLNPKHVTFHSRYASNTQVSLRRTIVNNEKRGGGRKYTFIGGHGL